MKHLQVLIVKLMGEINKKNVDEGFFSKYSLSASIRVS